MALTDSEIVRLKYELGYNLESVNAEPWIGVTQAFTLLVQPYLLAGASTTSATAVTAATTATPVTLTLVSGTGFSAFSRAVVDIDDRQEFSTIQSVSGNTIVVLLTKAHTGTYPVTVEGGESIVRELLNKIRAVKNQMATVTGYGALKKVDEIEFYASGTQGQFGMLGDQLMFWRDELASVIGVENKWRRKRGGGSTLSVY